MRAVSHETAFEELVQKMGGQLREALWTIGSYDSVGVFEAPNDETATTLALSYGSLGNAGTRTLRAFNRDEMAQIVQRTTSNPQVRNAGEFITPTPSSVHQSAGRVRVTGR